MFNYNKLNEINTSQLERWLGVDAVQNVQTSMHDWYGPAIAVDGVPGRVWAQKGGGFTGKINVGKFASALDIADDISLRLKRAWNRAALESQKKLPAGFASLSDLISEATSGGKRREYYFTKTGTTGVVNSCNSLWAVGAQPPAGANGSAAPGGRALDGSTTGIIYPQDPTGGTDTQHFVSGFPLASVAGNTLLLYDRIFDVAKTMNSSATESVTGVPTRYQSSVATDPDFAGGNFLFIECTTVLAATAHNWVTVLYRDEANNDNVTLPTVVGNSGNIVNRNDMPAGGYFFCPLATGDTGVKDLAQMQCSAAVATGAINFVIGHPLAFMPCPIANLVCVIDGINTAFNLVRIFNNCSMALMEMAKPTTTATSYVGSFTTVAG